MWRRAVLARVFNDDIQGTGATALAAFMAATKVAEVPLKEQRIIVQGAGTAGLGIVERIRDAMVQTEVSVPRSNVWSGSS